jgi:enoyl-CoA hydratase
MAALSPTQNTVIIEISNRLMTVTLNRPKALNSLTPEMIRSISAAMDEAKLSEDIRLVLFRGAGGRAFCAGGDIKAVAAAVKENRKNDAMAFFTEEYALDLCIHRFPKPVIAIVDGITMGGGLGLAAGADMIIATEKTRMAMPETRIGFFPDVGATGWMFEKCPSGYPEFLGLTGYEINGKEAVRVGFATDYMASPDMDAAVSTIIAQAPFLTGDKALMLKSIRDPLSPFFRNAIPVKEETDQWVRDYFAGKADMADLLSDLSQCSLHHDLCDGVFTRLSERSPTATVLTLKLLRHNEGCSLEDVFAAEAKAAEFILGHPDYLEGVRARLEDKDDTPQWRPDKIEDVDLAMIAL